jgi:hypothetical protein
MHHWLLEKIAAAANRKYYEQFFCIAKHQTIDKARMPRKERKRR